MSILDQGLRTSSAHVLRLQNLAASALAVAVACGVYALAPYGRTQLAATYSLGPWHFAGAEFLLAAATLYVLALALYLLRLAVPAESKSLRFWRLLPGFARAALSLRRPGFSRDDQVAVLATLLKMFYGPLMVMSLLGYGVGVAAHGQALLADLGTGEALRTLFDRHGFWFLMRLILVVDVLCFTVGYLVELPRLDNRIRSVDPTWLGWAAALLCYPPLNQVTGAILGSQVSDFPQFDNPTVHLALNLLLLVLMTGYASASVALGFKASNLTHRGIVSRGPYALVRHPAYLFKNLAWWIGAVPMVSAAFTQSLVDGVQAVASVIGWTMLYVMRALTEEDHLRSVDGDYAAYAARVRYRFIPGVV
jgi:protein-S-isoprenylcysteine O-methyltransferase Ste14